MGTKSGRATIYPCDHERLPIIHLLSSGVVWQTFVTHIRDVFCCAPTLHCLERVPKYKPAAIVAVLSDGEALRFSLVQIWGKT